MASRPASPAAADLAATALLPLPLPIVLRIFALLPVDCRLRCAEVCRAWRAALAERSLRTRSSRRRMLHIDGTTRFCVVPLLAPVACCSRYAQKER